MKRKFPVVLSMMLAAGLSTAPALQSNAAPHMHPYNGVEAEVNFGSSGVDIVTEADGRKVVSGIEKGDYFTVKTCDFSSGLASITITAKSEGMSVIEVRKGDASGESLGNIKLKSTDGEYQTFTANVKNLVGDNETITFVGSVGNVSIDSWSAAPLTDVETPEDPTQPENPDQPTQPEQPAASVDAYAGVEAENATQANAAVVLSADGVTYQAIRVNGYIVIKNVDLSNGISGILATARASKPKVSLDVYVDSLDSAPIAKINVTGASFKESGVKLTSDLTGTHDLYLVANGHTVDLDSFKVLPAHQTPEQPENPDQPQQPENPDQPEQPENPDQPQQPENPSTAEGKDVTYTINSWGTGYLVNFKVTNNTGSAVDGWTVRVRKDQVSIDSSWCVNITEEGDYYVITPLSWNTHVENGQTIEFGLIGTGSIGDSIYVTVE
ncbi:carbohydrate-binding protein [Butyrivibrio fibrisolvens]|uniref:carbohydrate-binding protein n=1 Tax=Butyrivibrio fibrisolvens TaxID=831 RepID=UPI00042690BC|nr:carbohydrate-binding protein [Butyrivibrio fibrisolvens]